MHHIKRKINMASDPKFYKYQIKIKLYRILIDF